MIYKKSRRESKLVNRPNSVIRRITETEKEVKKKKIYQK